MCGCLFGTLPQAPQQNIFLGLPLELMEEEAALLVGKGAAILLDDTVTHRSAINDLSDDEKRDIKNNIDDENIKLAILNYEVAQERKQTAIDNAKKKGIWKMKEKIEPPVPEVQPFESHLFIPAPEAEHLTSSSMANGLKEKHSSAEVGYREQNFDIHRASDKLVIPKGVVKQYIVPMKTTIISKLQMKNKYGLAAEPQKKPLRFKVYGHLQSLGFFLSPGLRFGCQFLAYPGDPLRFHSHYLVRSLECDEELPILDLVGGGRLGTGVKKAWMVAGSINTKAVESPSVVLDDIRCFCLEWAGFG